MKKVSKIKLNKSKISNTEPIKIGFVGAGPYVNTTELSSCFAIWIADSYFLNYDAPSVTYIQLSPLEDCNRNFFAQYSINRFVDKYDFIDIYADFLIDDSSKHETVFKVNKFPNTWLGVKWLVPGYNFDSLTKDTVSNSKQNNFNNEIYKLSSNLISVSESPIFIYNLGRGSNKEELFKHMDILIAVSSPSRTCIENAYNDINLIEIFRANGKPLMWLIDGYTSGIPKSFIREKLKGGNIQFLNKFDPEFTTQCNYKRIFLCEEGKIKHELWDFFNSAFRSFEKYIV